MIYFSNHTVDSATYSHVSGLLKGPFVRRLLKKAQMQGGVTHLRWVPGEVRGVLGSYVAAPRERANAADGPFSAACQGFAGSPLDGIPPLRPARESILQDAQVAVPLLPEEPVRVLKLRDGELVPEVDGLSIEISRVAVA